MNQYFDNPSLPFADGFSYKAGDLHCGKVPVRTIADGRQTPFYLYNIDAIVEKYRNYAIALSALKHRTCYAVKANSNITVLKSLQSAGCGFDVNSAGELFRACKAGVDPKSITMTGVGKTDADIRAALEEGILFLNAESESECVRIDRIAETMGVKADIVIRLNPDVSAETHPYIATGLAEHKFGLGGDEARAALTRLKDSAHVSIVGFGMHLGSQLFDTDPYVEGLEKLVTFAVSSVEEFNLELKYLNIGGGMGVSYDDTARSFPLDELAENIKKALDHAGLEVEVVSEPGRYLVANAGVLVATLEYIKENAGNVFYVVDAGMNDLIRPALYAAEHKALPVRVDEHALIDTADLVGPVCESGDTFLKKMEIPVMQPGELLSMFSAGAYGAVMSSRYNSRPLIEEVALIGGEVKTVRRRESPDDMVRMEL